MKYSAFEAYCITLYNTETGSVFPDKGLFLAHATAENCVRNFFASGNKFNHASPGKRLMSVEGPAIRNATTDWRCFKGFATGRNPYVLVEEWI
jgi:hypothetical protein